MASNSIVWFRNDLRLHDHRALTAAIDRSNAVACIYIVDPRFFTKTSFGFDRIGPHRLKFLRESLLDLGKSLADAGSTLIVLQGKAEDVLAEAAKAIGASHVYAHREYASEETAIEDQVQRSLADVGASLELSSANTLYELDDLPFEIEDLPELFTKFRRKVEASSLIRPPLATPQTIPSLDPNTLAKLDSVSIDQAACLQGEEVVHDERAVMPFKGGESEGLRRVNDYFWTDDCLKEYKETRNGMLGANYSSKFSPWLALGCLSPRQIHHEVCRYEEQRIKNDSTYWMIFELLWRDYFAWVTLKHGRRLFQVEGLRGQRIPWKQDSKILDRWREGTTGFPLIDANMRELAATGFMSNRGRQNVASFLTKNLGIDWRMGAQWFESMLIDYDPCSNYGNWNYVAGVGNDARQFRWFNTLKQSANYDPDGAYVRHWLPELADVPSEHVHSPWKMDRENRKQLDLVYPPPIVDLFKSAEQNQALHEAANEQFR
ncbi:Cryptochrome DASH [Rubripirellula obstinata]|uniref:Cryptochrome DASH n=1 Tax=Rubripirellula obstinata TaxID=406547 RepID=A0A5B1CLJ4_9BACT|nr:DASH family cryptochrome [Rubripirellula obstinata]KAA1260775.1 Cryptochrome DASH [Rubripirellula obstinata]